MKQIKVISPIYKKTAINFNGFIVNFDAEGKGIINFDEKETSENSINEIIKSHSNIYKGDKIPSIEGEKSTIDSNDKIVNLSEIEFLKESNKKLAIDNAELKESNKKLIIENTDLKESNEKLIIQNTELKELASDKPDRIFIEKDLNKKSVEQLKEILNTEDFLPFKEEWKDLITKEDIINFIMNKIK